MVGGSGAVVRQNRQRFLYFDMELDGLVLSHGCVLVSGLSGYIFVTRTSICDSS
jgi:hypothetical protein